MRAANTNPYSTGGGGASFEIRIQASFLVHLLTNTSIPGFVGELKDLRSVRLQARPKYQTDDICVCLSDTSDTQHTLLYQIKHKLSFNKGDGEYQKTIQQAWEDYANNRRFTKHRDKIIIVTGVLSSIDRDHVRPIFDFARNSPDVESFQTQVNTSKDKATKLAAIKEILAEYLEREITNEELKDFCAHLHLIHYDHDFSDQSKDRADTLALIKTGSIAGSKLSPEGIWTRLIEITQSLNQAGGEVTRTSNNLPLEIRKCFRTYYPESHELDPWNLQPLVGNFIARPSLVEALAKAVSDSKPNQVIAVYGPGGSGKTYLVTHFLNEAKNFLLRAWFPAETETELVAAYREFAQDLKLIDDSHNNEQVIKKVKHWLSQNTGWLIVFDNAESQEFVKKYRPATGGRVLVTTRYTANWPKPIIEVGVMSKEEALSLLYDRARKETAELDEAERVAFGQLAEELGYLALALAQAASYIDQCRITAAQYLVYLATEKKQLEAVRNVLEMNTLGDEHVPVLFTWDISLNYLQTITNGPMAVEILSACAYLHAESISEALLIEYLKKLHPDVEYNALPIDSLLRILNIYSLAQVRARTVSVHRVLQLVLRVKKHPVNFGFLLSVLAENFNYDRDDREAIDACRKLKPHAIAFLHLFEVDETNQDQLKNLAHLNYELGIYFLDYENEAKQAKQYMQEALSLSEKLAERPEGFVQRAQRQLAKIALRENNLAGAKALTQDVDTVGGLCDAASYYLKEFDLKRTETRKRKYTAADEVNLKQALEYLRFALAKLNLQERAEEGEGAKPRFYKERAKVQHYLGNAYCKINNFTTALNHFILAVEDKKKSYSKDHFELARSYKRLGDCYFFSRAYSDCIKYLKLALPIYETKYKNSGINSEYVELLRRLGIAHARMKEYSAATGTLKTYLDKTAALNPRNLVSVIIDYALCLHRLGETEQAITMLEKYPKSEKARRLLEAIRKNGNLDDFVKEEEEEASDQEEDEFIKQPPPSPPPPQARLFRFISSPPSFSAPRLIDSASSAAKPSSSFSYGVQRSLKAFLVSREKPSAASSSAQKKLSPHQFALENNFNLQRVAGDGNCFFAAVAVLLNNRDGTALTHADIRQQAVDYLRANADLHIGFDEDMELGTLNDYMTRMETAKTWAVGPIIDATALCFGVTLRIYDFRNNGDIHPVLFNEGEDKVQFNLVRTGEDANLQHYEPLLPNAEPEPEAALGSP